MDNKTSDKIIKCKICNKRLRGPRKKKNNIVNLYLYYIKSVPAADYVCDDDKCKNKFKSMLIGIGCYHCRKDTLKEGFRSIYEVNFKDQARYISPLCSDECYNKHLIEAKKLRKQEHKEHGKQCDACFTPTDKLFRCGNCKVIYYCSKECQVQHWNHCHKYECESLQV